MMQGSADTGRIESDLEHTRARLDATLDALQQKFSPGQMVDETMAWFKESGGGEFGRNLGRNVRDNPIPVALIGIGLGWLMLGGGRRHEPDLEWNEGVAYRGYDAPRYGTTGGADHQPLPYEAAAYDDLATKAHEAGARVERHAGESDDAFHERLYGAKGKAVGVSRGVGETLAAFRDRVETAIESAADQVRRLGREAGARVSSVAGDASDRAGDAARHGRSGLRSLYGYGQSAAYSARENAEYAGYRARDVGARTADYLKDQPLLMGVLGVTVGAVLGMLVPPTRYEREIAGDLRRSLGEQARGVASDLSQKASRVADDVLDTAHEAARREGFTNVSPGGVAHQAREGVADVAGRARTVAEETAAAGRNSLERELGTSKTEGAQPADHGDRRPVG